MHSSRYRVASRADLFWLGTLNAIHFLMIVLSFRCDLVWHRGRKENGDGKDNKTAYYNDVQKLFYLVHSIFSALWRP